MEEHVVLVNEQNEILGVAAKATVHTTDTPLHRGFSVFVFNPQGKFLITQRAPGKTFGGVWTNTVCGHPALAEAPSEAVVRRLQQELGITIDQPRHVHDYRYRVADAQGIVENEICPVFIGITTDEPQPKPKEIAAWRWVEWEWFLKEIVSNPQPYSPWCKEEAPYVVEFLAKTSLW